MLELAVVVVVILLNYSPRNERMDVKKRFEFS